MDIGDKVRVTKGNPFGKVGIITFVLPMRGPIHLAVGDDIDKAPIMKHFEIQTDDGSTYPVAEDQLELVDD